MEKGSSQQEIVKPEPGRLLGSTEVYPVSERSYVYILAIYIIY